MDGQGAGEIEGLVSNTLAAQTRESEFGTLVELGWQGDRKIPGAYGQDEWVNSRFFESPCLKSSSYGS